MLSNKAQSALYNIRHNILAAQRFTVGLTFEQFKQSDLHFYAIIRAREIVSEASRRLPESFRQRHPELPWKQIMGIGNVLRHDYDNVVGNHRLGNDARGSRAVARGGRRRDRSARP
jgi:uncharacterized protein with HEPN domain